MKNTMINAWVDFISFGKFSDADGWEPINAASELHHHYWNISGPDPEMSYNAVIEARMFVWEFVMDGLGTTTPAPATTRSASSKPHIGSMMLAVLVIFCLNVFFDI